MLSHGRQNQSALLEYSEQIKFQLVVFLPSLVESKVNRLIASPIVSKVLSVLDRKDSAKKVRKCEGKA